MSCLSRKTQKCLYMPLSNLMTQFFKQANDVAKKLVIKHYENSFFEYFSYESSTNVEQQTKNIIIVNSPTEIRVKCR